MRLSKEKQEGMWEHRPPPHLQLSVHLGQAEPGKDRIRWSGPWLSRCVSPQSC